MGKKKADQALNPLRKDKGARSKALLELHMQTVKQITNCLHKKRNNNSMVQTKIQNEKKQTWQ